MANITNTNESKDIKEVVEIVKEFFRKVKGVEGKQIDWYDFSVISVEPMYSELSEGKDIQQIISYKIICELKENIFDVKKEKYEIIVSVKGEVISVKRIENEQNYK